MAQTQITTPLRGVFRRAAQGQSEPAVADGGAVAQGDVIAYIEVHGQFNQLTSEEDGTDVSFPLEDGTKVNPSDVVAYLEA